MSKLKILNCLKKRALLNRSPIAAEELTAYGQYYETEGLIYDAVDFYERAGAVDQLKGLLEGAKQDGDAFLFRRLCRILGQDSAREDWLTLAERAEALGKTAFAQMAYKEAGEEPDAGRGAEPAAQ